MKAMILAAGKGERLGSLTRCTPKVLLPVDGRPIIEHAILWLKSHGITEIAVNVHHLAGQVMDYLSNGKHLGVRIEYSVEEQLLGTASGVKKMAPFLGDNFVVVCGDIYTDFNLQDMIKFHLDKKSMATVVLFQADRPWEVGIVDIDNEGRITYFIEKPSRLTEIGNLANGGVYVLNKEILGYITNKSQCDFGHDVFPKLSKGELSIYGYPISDDYYLVDIGTVENYKKVNSGKLLKS